MSKFVKATLIAGFGLAFGITSAYAQQVKSVRVVDGDTVVVGKTKIRITGIDAPEIFAASLKKSSCPIPEKALGLKAKARAEELLDMSKHKVTVKYSKGKDAYGRSLASVYSDGKNVANTLVAEGLALPWLDMKKPRPVFCAPQRIRLNVYRNRR